MNVRNGHLIDAFNGCGGVSLTFSFSCRITRLTKWILFSFFLKYVSLELEESSVWVYFHSNMEEFNRVEYWGPLREAACKVKKRTVQ